MCHPRSTNLVGRPARGARDPFASQEGWLPFALGAGVRAAQARPVDAGHSTSPPLAADVVAGIVARAGRVPRVTEFHDGWLGNPIREALGGSRTWLHRRLRVGIERRIPGSADRIAPVSQSMAGLDGQRDPGRVADTLGAAAYQAHRVGATRSASPLGARDDG